MKPPETVVYMHCPVCGTMWRPWDSRLDVYHGTEMMCTGDVERVTYTLTNIEHDDTPSR